MNDPKPDIPDEVVERFARMLINFRLADAGETATRRSEAILKRALSGYELRPLSPDSAVTVPAELIAAARVFVENQRTNLVPFINKAAGDMEPITITVTKGQYRRFWDLMQEFAPYKEAAP